jgi:DNA polymerase-3 subunit beta
MATPETSMNALANIVDVATASLDYPAFKKAMLNACKVVDKNVTIPVLGTVIIRQTRGGAQVIGTDLDRYISTFVAGEMSADFIALIDAHRLGATMDKVKDASTINFTTGTDTVVASIGKLQLTLVQKTDVADFPEQQAFRTELGKSNCSFILPASQLRVMLDKVSFAISTEATRYYLNGIYMHVASYEEKLTFVATDGHRLARFQIDVPAGAGSMPDAGVIIPHKTAIELRRLVSRKDCPSDVLVTATPTGVSFLIGEDELLESKVVVGTYPDYGRVVPTHNEHKVGIQRQTLMDAIKQVSSIKTEKSKGVRLSFTDGRLTLSCQDPEFGRATTELKSFGTFELDAGFNASYLLEILGQLEGGAMLELQDSGSPVVIKDGADDRITYAQMPLRV